MDAAPDIDTLADEDRDRVLETVLGAYRMRVEITADVRYCGTWYDQEPATRHGQFHLLTWANAGSAAPHWKPRCTCARAT